MESLFSVIRSFCEPVLVPVRKKLLQNRTEPDRDIPSYIHHQLPMPQASYACICLWGTLVHVTAE